MWIFAVLFVLAVTSGSTAKELPVFLERTSRQTLLKLNRGDSCARCKKECSNVNQINRWTSDCHNARAQVRKIKKRDEVIKSRKKFGFPDALLFYCFKQYCRKFKPRHYCGLATPGSEYNMAKLNTEMTALKKENAQLEYRWRREARSRFKFRDYRERRTEALKLQKEAKRNLNVVLNARKENHRLRKKLKGLEYRKQIFDVNKWSNETQFYNLTTFYWGKLNETLAKALVTSSIAVVNVRKSLDIDLQRMKTDVRDVRRLQKSVENEDKELNLLDRKKTQLERRIEEVKLEIVAADTDYLLFRRISGSMTNVLRDMTSQIKSGKLKVGCTNDALAQALADFTTSAI